jgi:hypothetical protein
MKERPNVGSLLYIGWGFFKQRKRIKVLILLCCLKKWRDPRLWCFRTAQKTKLTPLNLLHEEEMSATHNPFCTPLIFIPCFSISQTCRTVFLQCSAELCAQAHKLYAQATELVNRSTVVFGRNGLAQFWGLFNLFPLITWKCWKTLNSCKMLDYNETKGLTVAS